MLSPLGYLASAHLALANGLYSTKVFQTKRFPGGPKASAFRINPEKDPCCEGGESFQAFEDWIQAKEVHPILLSDLLGWILHLQSDVLGFHLKPLNQNLGRGREVLPVIVLYTGVCVQSITLRFGGRGGLRKVV